MTFERLYRDAIEAPIRGWDFGWLGDRYRVGAKPWRYRKIVQAAASGARVVVDLGTGGGEWWAALALEAPVQVATECWAPNVALAAERLRPLGVHVATHPGAPDNVEWVERGGELPLRSGAVDVLHSRHESYSPTEVARVVRRGGCFVTQQVGAEPLGELADALGVERTATGWTAAFAVAQIEAAGMRVVDGAAARVPVGFADVGAVVYYARMVPWAFPGLDVERDVDCLRGLHDRMARTGGFTAHDDRFWLRAEHA